VERRVRVLGGACDDLLTVLTLGPFHEVCRSLGGDIGRALATTGRPAIPAGLRALAVRLATENATSVYDGSTVSSPTPCTAPASTPHADEPDPPGPNS
jgi:hypothetical protein